MNVDLLYTGIIQGLILGIISFGIMIPFRFLNFPDLTAEGAYPLGGAVYASLIVAGTPQLLAILFSILAGGIAGLCTSQIALRFKINTLLSGIIISTMIYSINLRIMGKPNIALFELEGIKLGVTSILMLIASYALPFAFFLHTDFGLRFRSIGNNPKFAIKQRINLDRYTNLGMFIAGSIFSLAGSMMAQIQEFMDVGMGIGMVIHGLASLMIGESLIGNNTILKQLMAPIVGALLYQQVQGIALSLGLAPSDLKFFTGFIVLVVSGFQKKSE